MIRASLFLFFLSLLYSAVGHEEEVRRETACRRLCFIHADVLRDTGGFTFPLQGNERVSREKPLKRRDLQIFFITRCACVCLVTLRNFLLSLKGSIDEKAAHLLAFCWKTNTAKCARFGHARLLRERSHHSSTHQRWSWFHSAL